MLLHLLKESLPWRRGGAPTEAVQAIAALVEAGDLQRAETDCCQLIGRFGDDPEICRWMGRILGMTNRHEEAIAYLQKTIGANPSHREALADLGTVYWFNGDVDNSIRYYDRVLRLDPDHATALHNKALILAESGRTGEAADTMWRVLIQAPRHDGALRHYVRWMIDSNRHQELKDNLEHLLAMDEEAAAVHEALGYVLLKRFYLAPDALDHFQKSVRLGMKSSELYGNRGIALQDVGRLDEALKSYDLALDLDPHNHGARVHRALANLLLGNFADGWPDYETRLLNQVAPRTEFSSPAWSGEDLSQKTILLSAEQGIGDQIMFASCLPEVIRRAKRCMIECAPKLEPIYRRSFPAATVIGASQHQSDRWLEDVPKIDYHTPVGSLPLRLRLFQDTFPAPPPYLQADPERVQYWKSRLDALGPGLKLGISWRGGAEKWRRDVKTCPPSHWKPISEIPGAHFICLQYDATPAEADEASRLWGKPVHFWDEALENYDETAALVCALDLVVSVCTSLIHLAGALGAPVMVMAPLVPDWRYGLHGEQMIWYPSVRIFRQDRYGEWNSVVGRVSQEIRRLEPARQ